VKRFDEAATGAADGVALADFRCVDKLSKEHIKAAAALIAELEATVLYAVVEDAVTAWSKTTSASSPASESAKRHGSTHILSGDRPPHGTEGGRADHSDDNILLTSAADAQDLAFVQGAVAAADSLTHVPRSSSEATGALAQVIQTVLLPQVS
jgi:hypothetical protein